MKWSKTNGISTITEIAKFKSESGHLRFGKGFSIELMPSCLYSKELPNKIYNSKENGYVFIEDGIPKFTPAPEGYHDTIRTMCKEDGSFEFNNLLTDRYYVIAFMLWDKTGGGIMQNVVLSEGESKVIEMNNF